MHDKIAAAYSAIRKRNRRHPALDLLNYPGHYAFGPEYLEEVRALKRSFADPRIPVAFPVTAVPPSKVTTLVLGESVLVAYMKDENSVVVGGLLPNGFYLTVGQYWPGTDRCVQLKTPYDDKAPDWDVQRENELLLSWAACALAVLNTPSAANTVETRVTRADLRARIKSRTGRAPMAWTEVVVRPGAFMEVHLADHERGPRKPPCEHLVRGFYRWSKAQRAGGARKYLQEPFCGKRGPGWYEWMPEKKRGNAALGSKVQRRTVVAPNEVKPRAARSKGVQNVPYEDRAALLSGAMRAMAVRSGAAPSASVN
jgi:hypothetical protein